MPSRIHPAAIVEKGARIGEGSVLWRFSHVRAGAVLGDSVMLGQGVYVAEGARIGDRTRIQNGVSVFNGVTLEEDVFVGPGVVFTNDRYPRARRRRCWRPERTLVRSGATLGAASVILPGLAIGRCAMTAAGAVVTRSVPDFALVAGNPARWRGWVCRCGVPLRRQGHRDWKCVRCGRCYLQRRRRLLEASGILARKKRTPRENPRAAPEVPGAATRAG